MTYVRPYLGANVIDTFWRVANISTKILAIFLEMSQNVLPRINISKMLNKYFQNGENSLHLVLVSPTSVDIYGYVCFPNLLKDFASWLPDVLPKIPIWVNFEGPWNGECWYVLVTWNNLRPFGIFYGQLVS
jgi:hypothetical protein